MFQNLVGLGVRYSFANQLVECSTWSGARGKVFLCSGVSVSSSKYVAVGLIHVSRLASQPGLLLKAFATENKAQCSVNKEQMSGTSRQRPARPGNTTNTEKLAGARECGGPEVVS